MCSTMGGGGGWWSVRGGGGHQWFEGFIGGVYGT